MTPPLLYLSDATSAQLATTQHLVIDISAEQVRAGDVESLVARLAMLTTDLALVDRLEDKALLVIDGFSNDPRELYEIPEVLSYFREVTAQWPYWLHFLSTHGDCVRNAFLLLADTKVLGRQLGQVDVWFPPDQLHSILMPLFEAMNELQAAVSRTDQHTCVRSDAVIAAIGLE